MIPVVLIQTRWYSEIFYLDISEYILLLLNMRADHILFPKNLSNAFLINLVSNLNLLELLRYMLLAWFYALIIQVS